MSRAPFRRSDEQARAADPAAHVWVGASAGSGKTLVLVDRILRLLLGGTAPERLLCITFTKQAAAEMANRLHGELEGWVGAPDALLDEHLGMLGATPSPDLRRRARQLFARVLDTPGGLRIQTIHAFCESVLGRFPLEAGISPQFSVLDERDSVELLNQARDTVLDAARNAPGGALAGSVVTVSSRVGEEGLTQVLDAMMRDRARFLEARRDGADAHALVRAVLGVAAHETPESIVEAACIEAAFAGAALRRVAAAMLQSSVSDRRKAEAMVPWLAADVADRVRMFGIYVRAYLKDDGKPFKDSATQAILKAHSDADDALRAEAERLVAVLDRQRRAEVARASAALVTLADHLFAEYERLKALLNRLDYGDLILRTRALLQTPDMAPWVLFKLDGGIDHVLVDEAQDTSPEQWDIIAALTAEFFAGEGAREPARTLFVVGDEKQSIYSFQGADPEAFDTMLRHFQESAQRVGETLREVPLITSYRSVPAVLTFVDEAFREQDARAGVVRRAWENHRASRADQPGLIELWDPVKITHDKDEEDGWPIPHTQITGDRAETWLARRIARLIAHWLQHGEMLEATGKPVGAGDILILVRRRNRFFNEMVVALKREGVPVAGADRMILTGQIAVMDLMALGRAVLLPEDDLSLAEVLKGPLVGLDDDQLFAIAWNRGEQPLWSALRARAEQDPAFAAARDALQHWMAEADFLAPFDFYARILGGGGREKMLARLGAEASDPMDEFLNLALAYQRDHPASLQGFLHWLETGGAEIKRDLDQARQEVRVMTVHAAKGLEAPIVFLPDTTALPNPQQDHLFWSKGEPRVPLWLQRKEDHVGAAATAWSLADRRRQEEYRRLFYVAATRARDRLYIGGYGDPRPASWYALAQRALAQKGTVVTVDFPQEPGVAVRRLDTRGAVVRPVAEATPAVARAVALPDWIDRPPPAEPIPPRPLVPSRPSGDEPAVRGPFATDDTRRFQRGIAIHRLLQVLPGLLPLQQSDVMRRYLARPTLNFSEEDRHEIAGAVYQVLHDPRFAPVFAVGSVAEAPIAGRMGDLVISGQIDRLAITPGEVLIVDYKTNRHAPAGVDAVPLAYRRQMAAYWAALRRMYPNRSVRAALLWTEGPVLMELPPDLLAAHAP